MWTTLLNNLVVREKEKWVVTEREIVVDKVFSRCVYVCRLMLEIQLKRKLEKGRRELLEHCLNRREELGLEYKWRGCLCWESELFI